MSDTVIFYAVVRSWKWLAFSVIKETDRTFSYIDSRSRPSRMNKPQQFYRFNNETQAEDAMSKLTEMEIQHRVETKKMRERHANEIDALAATFNQQASA